MGHWRLKFVFCLIFYFGGFLTAVYVLAPASASAQTQTKPQSTAFANVDTQAWTGKLREGISQAVSFAEENALRAAELIRAKTGQGD